MDIWKLVVIPLIVAVVALVLAAVVKMLERRRIERKAAEERRTYELTRDSIHGWTSRKVREGFLPRDEIVDLVTEIVEDEVQISGLKERVAEETDRLLEEHLREQMTWSGETDCDRIDAAFDELEGRGIVSRQNFTCCQTCGVEEIGEEIRKHGEKGEPVGYVFYHEQDTEGACEDGSLFLSYGGMEGTPEEAVEIGEVVREVLKKHGLTVDWNGTVQKRICVTGLDWRKRRTRG